MLPSWLNQLYFIISSSNFLTQTEFSDFKKTQNNYQNLRLKNILKIIIFFGIIDRLFVILVIVFLSYDINRFPTETF